MRWWTRFTARQNREPAVAPGHRLYAVGDIHGRADLLDRMLTEIQEDSATASSLWKTLVFLGDYVDRGEHSRTVIDRLANLSLPDWKLVFLRGNHDQAVLDFLANPGFYGTWRNFGAPETLLSYGVSVPRFERDYEAARDQLALALPAGHLAFLQKLELSYSRGDYYFCHAGVRPGIALEKQAAEDLLWIRDEFLYCHRPFEKVVVHGHTPSIAPVKTAFRIGVDTGAHATNCLTAAVLEDKGCRFLQTTAAPLPLKAEAFF